ncbi:putative disease resistance protein At1g50180 [Phragmites australis]|uniref:putative disease resistance protein At1g50180 n=1 Tax=Phragmites australis TaxID=29695 RepID=UPI002D779290|nr:putative disease resistance protein At1g50180 [Phragmites australis]
MAESLLLPVAGKAAAVLVQSVTRMWGVDDDRRKLEHQLVYVQCLLADAEVKSKTNHAVGTWTKELKAVAYQADDVLDDFQYEALRREPLSGRSMAWQARYRAASPQRIDLCSVIRRVGTSRTFSTRSTSW